MSLLERETIRAALVGLDERLGARGCRAELLLVGGGLGGCLALLRRGQAPVRVRLLIEEMFDDRG